MKKRLFLMFSVVLAAISMFAVSSCIKFTNGTGVLTVVAYDLPYDYEVAVYPYGQGVEDVPIVSTILEKGRKRETSFTLNAGDYVVYCGFEYQAVQVQEGDSVIIYFDRFL